MATDDAQDQEAFVGRRAIDWLFGRPNGGHFFDGALTGVSHAVGDEVAIGAFAPLGLDAEATDFFLAVDGRVGNDENWERLVEAHLVLSSQTRHLRGGTARPTSRTRDPFERFHLVMEPNPPEPVAVHEATRAWLRR